MPTAPIRPVVALAALVLLATIGGPATASTSPDTMLHDPLLDPAGSRQASPVIVVRGTEAVAVWYDLGTFQRLQWAFSSDSGKTFADQGDLSPPAAPLRWGAEAELTCNEKTGELWAASQVGGTPTERGIGVARGVFTGGGIAWDPPVTARLVATVGASGYQVPCVAIAADSSEGTVHLLYTEYMDANGHAPDRIHHQRSTDGGATWSAPTVLDAPLAGKSAYATRLTMLAPGVVLATWLRSTTGDDLELRWARSSDGGLTFPDGGQVTGFRGTGFGVAGPARSYSVAAERRTNALGVGRAVIAITDSWDVAADPIPDPGTAPHTAEVEPNNSDALATPFAVGHVLDGAFGVGVDSLDTWEVSLAAGEAIVMTGASGSLASFSFSVVSPAGTVIVAGSGPGTSPLGFRAPAAGTYRLRVRPAGGFSGTPSYSIHTSAGSPGPGEARDHSDLGLLTLEPGASTWSAPVWLADTPVGSVDRAPGLHVAADGHLYLAWWDLGTDAGGVVGHVRLVRDPLAGPGPVVTLTGAASNWSSVVSLTDRTALASVPHRLVVGWTDARFGNLDARAVSIPVGVRFESFTNDAALPRELARMHVSYRNANPHFTEPLLTQRVRGARGWPSGQIQRSNLAPDAVDGVSWLVTVRDTAAVGPNPIAHSVFFGDSALVGTCVASLEVLGCDTLRVQEQTLGVEAPIGLAAADLDRDGHLDLVVASEAGPYAGLSFALNDAEGGFQPVILWGDGTPSRWPVATDLTGDGYPDLVEAAGTSVRTWVNLSSAGQYSADYELVSNVALPGGDAVFVTPGDFDEDGITDLLAASFANPNGWIWLLRGNGAGGAWDGTFASPVQVFAGGRVSSVAVADFNEDGVADLAFATPSFATSHVLHIMMGLGTGGRGNGTFAPPVTQANANGGGLNPATGDFNEDGITDLAFTVTRGILVYLGNGTAGVGDGTFGAPTPHGFSQLPSAPSRLAVADLTLDGRADIVVNCGSADRIAVLAGGGVGSVGDGTFAPSSARPVGDFPQALVVGDFVDDGIPNVADVAVANRNGNTVTIVRGLCAGALPFDLFVHEPDALPGGPTQAELLPTAWPVGSEQTIRWTAGAAIGTVDVELSRDGGDVWERLASGVTGGEFAWTVTGPGTEAARIRVRDAVVAGWSDATASPLRVLDATVGAPGSGAPRVAAFSLVSTNPSRGEVAFTLALPRAGAIEVEAFDVAGTRVATLARGRYDAGTHAIRWVPEAGRGARAGVYFVRARGPAFEFTRRVVRR